jgi:hypothetical protein
MIFTVVRVGTAKNTPGIPHAHPPKRIATNTIIGFKVKRLPRISGVRNRPSSPVKQRKTKGGRMILGHESKVINATAARIRSITDGPK